MRIAVFLIVLFLNVTIEAQVSARKIAVTIDDLPVVSTRSDLKNRQTITKKLLEHIRNARIPAIGFVNENKLYNVDKRDEDQIGLLRMWIDAGLELGNHTFSHRSLNQISLAEYQADLLHGETITKELLQARGKKIRYFRHPYLQTGRTMDVKSQFAAFLSYRGYKIAPITFDNADYIFARAYDNAFDKKDAKLMKRVGDAYVPYMEAKLDYWERQSRKLFDREISQTMLIHANFINSDHLDDLAEMLRKRGYRFVSLEEALKDDAYRLPDTFLGAAGISWLHRWAMRKDRDLILRKEPMVPDFVLKASGFESE